MVDRIRYPTVSYLPFYYVFFQFLLLTIFNLQANILTTKDILSNLVHSYSMGSCTSPLEVLMDHNPIPAIVLFMGRSEKFFISIYGGMIKKFSYELVDEKSQKFYIFFINFHRRQIIGAYG